MPCRHRSLFAVVPFSFVQIIRNCVQMLPFLLNVIKFVWHPTIWWNLMRHSGNRQIDSKIIGEWTLQPTSSKEDVCHEYGIWNSFRNSHLSDTTFSASVCLASGFENTPNTSSFYRHDMMISLSINKISDKLFARNETIECHAYWYTLEQNHANLQR